MKLCTELIRLRKEHAMTQETFGQLFHVTRQTVSNWENEKSYPDLQTLVAISDYFGVSLDTLLKEDKSMISTIDTERRKGKRLARVLAGMLCVMLLAGAGYGGYWAYARAQFEKQYVAALSAHHFEPKIIKDENNEDVATGTYIATDGAITYTVYPPDFPALRDLRVTIDEKARVVAATCTKDGMTLRLRLGLYPTFNDDPRCLTFYLDKGMVEKSRGVLAQDAGPEYTLNADGTLPDSVHLDEETARAYDAMKEDVRHAATTMQTMLDDFYA